MTIARLGVPVKRHTTSLRILQELRSVQVATTNDLIDRTGLSRPTVHSACDDLIAASWAQEMDSVPVSGPGRPSRSFRLAARTGAVIGVDMGRACTRVAVADLRGDILAEAVEQLRPSARSATRLSTVDRLVERVRAQAGVEGDQLFAFVLGIPAPVAADTITASREYLGDLPEVRLRERLEAAHGVRVALENDANLAVLAERTCGAAQGSDHVVALLAGERLGAGVVLDGRLLHGARGAVGEIGGAGLLAGVRGAYGVAPLVREATRAALQDAPRRYAALAGDVPADEIDVARVFELAATDRATRRLVERAIRPVARVIAMLQLLLDPEVIVVDGAVADAEGLLNALRAGIPDHEELRRRPVRLAASPLGARAVVVGAVTAALEHTWDDLATPEL